MRETLIALVLVTTACQSPEPQGAMVASTPVPVVATPPPPPTDPAVLVLLGTTPELPDGFAAMGRELDPNRAGKFTLVLDGPFASQRLSYTVYVDAAEAGAAFVGIGQTPADRNVIERESFAPGGFDGEVWAETSKEEYGDNIIYRTAAAVVLDRAVVLAQVVAHTEPSPIAAKATEALLHSAVAHMRGALAPTPPDPNSAAASGESVTEPIDTSSTPSP